MVSRIASATFLAAALVAGVPSAKQRAALCDSDGVLLPVGHTASSEEALRSRTTATSAAFAALPLQDLQNCGSSSGFASNVSRAEAIARCNAMDGCFSVDYYPNKEGGSAYFCREPELQLFGQMVAEGEGVGMEHLYKVRDVQCSSAPTEPLRDARACGADMVLSNYAASRSDAIRSRTSVVGAAFAALPQNDLVQCGSDGSFDVGISQNAALQTCGTLDSCFSIDYYPNLNGGTAYYCNDVALETFGARENMNAFAGMVHLYKVKGTSCTSLRSESVHSCDSELVLQGHHASHEDAISSRTTALHAGYATLASTVLTGCGSAEEADKDISRAEALARCATRHDCYSVDYYTASKSAYYCTDHSLASFQMVPAQLRGSRIVDHFYKVKGMLCDCTDLAL
eukprot:TRINITY_DN9740_c0_g1_i1.p1 TRINITY_DN9740_c0_g1~~TRINITY_DN9740_c0_g1_i1.p1  ORF type:complete len:427 (-),score=52.44 TRINITY_DN9740_c0_g1_i1:235-1431(-)